MNKKLAEMLRPVIEKFIAESSLWKARSNSMKSADSAVSDSESESGEQVGDPRSVFGRRQGAQIRRELPLDR